MMDEFREFTRFKTFYDVEILELFSCGRVMYKIRTKKRSILGFLLQKLLATSLQVDVSPKMLSLTLFLD